MALSFRCPQRPLQAVHTAASQVQRTLATSISAGSYAGI